MDSLSTKIVSKRDYKALSNRPIDSNKLSTVLLATHTGLKAVMVLAHNNRAIDMSMTVFSSALANARRRPVCRIWGMTGVASGSVIARRKHVRRTWA